MNKPTEFQIEIANKTEFQQAFDFLSKHYPPTDNPAESKYHKGCMIKVGRSLEPRLWSSVVGKTNSYTTYNSWEEFLDAFSHVFGEKPTFNHCAELVSLDQDMAMLQIHIADLEEMLAKQKETFQKYLTRTEELNIILGII